MKLREIREKYADKIKNGETVLVMLADFEENGQTTSLLKDTFFKDGKGKLKLQSPYKPVDLDDENLIPYYKEKDFTADEIKIVSVDEYVRLNKFTIKFAVERELATEGYNNAKYIANEVKEKAGKIIRYCGDIRCSGLLVCATSTNEDYYYCYVTIIDGELKLMFSSCVGSCDVVPEEELTESEKSLRYALQEDPEYVRDFIEEKINEGETDIIFTELKIK